jgi:hypothetical protein
VNSASRQASSVLNRSRNSASLKPRTLRRKPAAHAMITLDSPLTSCKI